MRKSFNLLVFFTRPIITSSRFFLRGLAFSFPSQGLGRVHVVYFNLKYIHVYCIQGIEVHVCANIVTHTHARTINKNKLRKSIFLNLVIMEHSFKYYHILIKLGLSLT